MYEFQVISSSVKPVVSENHRYAVKKGDVTAINLQFPLY